MRTRVKYSDGEPIGVYAIIGPSGKVYVGMTCDSFERRWRGHLKTLKRQTHRCRGLQYTYDKYDWDALNKVILEQWEKPDSLEELLILERTILLRERYWWEQFYLDGATMLHGCPTGTGSVKHSPETRAKIAASTKHRSYPQINSNYFTNSVLNREQRNEVIVKLQKYSSLKEAKKETGVNLKVLKGWGFTDDELSAIPFLRLCDSDPSYEMMYDLYVTQRLSIREIGRIIGKSHPAVLRILSKRGIETRTNALGAGGAFRPFKSGKGFRNSFMRGV